MYENELVFLAGVTPWTPVASAGDLSAVVENAHRLIYANRNHPEQSTTGSLRRGDTHWVYGRAGRPCRRCGTTVRTARLGRSHSGNYDRIAFWCPACQHGPAPA